MDVLFVGNGLNRVSADLSWAAVLRDLVPHAALPDTFVASLDAKPFTLAFEELCFLAAEHAAGDGTDTTPVGDLEADLKRRVAETISRIPPNELHAQAMATAGAAAAATTRHIITTNYDYNLELASDLDFGASETDETKYSLRRRRVARTEGGGELSVWHIHGEARVPRTLMLSHDHYVRYINRMRRFVPADVGAREEGGPDHATTHTPADTSTPPTWVTLFLESDVHVVGFGFDYTEIELWWLLSLKRREALRGRAVGKTVYYPVVAPGSDYTKAREEILASYGVTVDARFRRKTHGAGYAAFLEAWRGRV